LAGSVFAETVGVSKDVETFVKEVAKNKGVDMEKVKSVEKVDFDALPAEINIKNIDETNLAVYKINYGEEKPFFVLTVSDKSFKKTLKEIANKMILNFGFEGDIKNSVFLKTATGVQGSKEKGYVMIRKGSITGLSTNLEVSSVKNSGEVEIIIYKNQEPVGFRNTFIINSTGVQKDYDLVSEETINFEPGDVISVYAETSENLLIKDIITIMEINVLE